MEAVVDAVPVEEEEGKLFGYYLIDNCSSWMTLLALSRRLRFRDFDNDQDNHT